MRYRFYTVFFLFLFLPFSFLPAQDSVVSPKIGLALSGGGAKGFAHIGVLKVLEEIDFPIDYISGTSMGSIVGGLYAIGYDAEEMRRIVLEADWEDLFDDRTGRRHMPLEEKIRDGRYLITVDIVDWKPKLPSGMIAGQKISSFLSRLTWPAHHVRNFRDFPIPFICVATDIQTGEAVALDSGNLAEAIRASMAIPTIFTPVRINGRLLVDGLIARNLPAEEVKQLGADIIVGVDVSSGLKSAGELNSMVAILDQSLSFQMVSSTARQRQMCDLLIEPSFGNLTVSDFLRAEEIIRLGEEAAHRQLPRLIALRDSVRSLQSLPHRAARHSHTDSVFITKIKITGNLETSRRLIRTHLGLKPPVWATRDDLDQAVLRVFGTGIFERVTYELEPAQNGMLLRLHITERPEHQFRFSFRYDTYSKATVLLNTTFRNFLRRGSVWRTDVRLSTEFAVNSGFTLLTEIPPRLGLNATFDYENFRMSLYHDGKPVTTLRAQIVRSEMMLGSIFSREMIFGAGISKTWNYADRIVGEPLPFPKKNDFHSLFGMFFIDTHNKTYFPTRGFQWFNRFDWSGKAVGSRDAFRRFESDLTWVIPLHPKWSFIQTARFSGISGDIPSPALMPHLGGHDQFAGLYPFEKTGRYMKMIRSGLQWEWLPRRTIAVKWNMGLTENHLSPFYRFHKPVHGAVLTLGAETFIGPVEISGMTSRDHPFLTYLNIGYKF